MNQKKQSFYNHSFTAVGVIQDLLIVIVQNRCSMFWNLKGPYSSLLNICLAITAIAGSHLQRNRPNSYREKLIVCGVKWNVLEIHVTDEKRIMELTNGHDKPTSQEYRLKYYLPTQGKLNSNIMHGP